MLDRLVGFGLLEKQSSRRYRPKSRVPRYRTTELYTTFVGTDD